MLRLAFDFIITWRETRTRPNAYLLQEIELQKRIEMWGEGRRLFDMKRRNESLDRTHAINHSAIAPKEVPAGSKLFIYQIPDKELNANSEITDKNE